MLTNSKVDTEDDYMDYMDYVEVDGHPDVYYLNWAEEQLTNKLKSKQGWTDIHEVLKFYRIKQAFNLASEGEAKYKDLKDQSDSLVSSYIKDLKNINTIKLQLELNQIDIRYVDCFWSFVSDYQLIKQFGEEIIISLLNNEMHLRACLHNEKMVKKLNSAVKNALMNSTYAIEYILAPHRIERDNSMPIYLPSCLTNEDKFKIIKEYIERDDANINIVRMLDNLKESVFDLPAKLRKRIFEVKESLTKRIFNNGFVSRCTFELAFNNQDHKMECTTRDDGTLTISLDKSYIKSLDYIQRIKIFASMFSWINRDGLISLISKESDMHPFESVLLKNDHIEGSYLDSISFNNMERVAYLLLVGYSSALEGMGISVEVDLKYFYESFLKERYDYPALVLDMPIKGLSWRQKVKILCPNLDSIAKRHNCFAIYGDETLDYYKFDNKQIKRTESKSIVEIKYCELTKKSKNVRRIAVDLFGRSCRLSNPMNISSPKCHTFYDWLHHGVGKSDYNEYQLKEIEFLVEKGVVKIDDAQSLKVVSETLISALKSLWEYQACVYWLYDSEVRTILDNWIEDGDLKKSDSLLCQSEKDFFSYYLDNQFKNAKAIRNKYMHGDSVELSDEDDRVNYYTLLSLLILLILKIENDLSLTRYLDLKEYFGHSDSPQDED